jgi:hypothetical protein
MGATEFGKTVIGVYKDAYDAFYNEKQRSQWEHGHKGYTGTIAEKTSFRMIECPPRKNPYKFAQDLIVNKDPRIDDKWGPAGCIEIKRSFLKKLKDKHPELKGRRNVKAYIFFGWASC